MTNDQEPKEAPSTNDQRGGTWRKKAAGTSRNLVLGSPAYSLFSLIRWEQSVSLFVACIDSLGILLPLGEHAGALLRSIPGRRYIGPFRPAYKLSAELAHRLRLAELPAEPSRIDVTLFHGEEPDALARAIGERFAHARITFVERRQPARITLEVPARTLRPLVGSLIRDPAVAFVSPRHPLVLHNDQGIWIGQSYDRLHGPDEAHVVV